MGALSWCLIVAKSMVKNVVHCCLTLRSFSLFPHFLLAAFVHSHSREDSGSLAHPQVASLLPPGPASWSSQLTCYPLAQHLSGFKIPILWQVVVTLVVVIRFLICGQVLKWNCTNQSSGAPLFSVCAEKPHSLYLPKSQALFSWFLVLFVK